MKKLAFLICLPLVSFTINATAVDGVEVVGERPRVNAGLVAASQAQDAQDSGAPSATISTEANAQKTAAEEKWKVYQACGEKRVRIKTFTDTYQTCNYNTQLAYNISLGDCPSAVQEGTTWGIKTKDGTTFGYSRNVAENAGAQCRTDASSIQTSTFINVCDKNYSAAKEAEGEMPQVCKDAGI